MSLRESILEQFAGDLEYHPRRGALYLGLAAASLSFLAYSPAETKFTTIPLAFGLGGVTLLLKGIFLFRRSSEGIGLSDQDIADLSVPSRRKALPSIPNLVAQIVQDFGAGPFLLWPVLNAGKDIDSSWSDPPRFEVFATGAIILLAGWVIRRLTSSPQQ